MKTLRIIKQERVRSERIRKSAHTRGCNIIEVDRMPTHDEVNALHLCDEQVIVMF